MGLPLKFSFLGRVLLGFVFLSILNPQSIRAATVSVECIEGSETLAGDNASSTNSRITNAMMQALIARMRGRGETDAEHYLAGQGVSRGDYLRFQAKILDYSIRRQNKDWNVHELAAHLGVSPAVARYIKSYFNPTDAPGRAPGIDLNNYVTKRALAEAHSKTIHDAFLSRNAKRIKYYRDNLTKKSVSEMVEELRAEDPHMSKSKLYEELWVFKLSIEEAWSRNVEGAELQRIEDLAARDRMQLGTNALSVPLVELAETLYKQARNQGSRELQALRRVAMVLDVGVEALRDIFLYTGVITRTGRKWTSLEDNVINGAYHTQTAKEIADLINSINLARGLEPRSEESVRRRARELGLTSENDIGDPDVNIAGYGYVKRNGVFDPGKLRDFLLDHFDHTDKDVARHLSVNPSTISRWRRRLGVYRLNGLPVQRSTLPPRIRSGAKTNWNGTTVGNAFAAFARRSPNLENLGKESFYDSLLRLSDKSDAALLAALGPKGTPPRDAYERWNARRLRLDLRRDGRNVVQNAAYRIANSYRALGNRIFSTAPSVPSGTRREGENLLQHNANDYLRRWSLKNGDRDKLLRELERYEETQGLDGLSGRVREHFERLDRVRRERTNTNGN